MYSIVEFKGHQYQVAPGDMIDVEKVEAAVGSTIELDQVLFVGGTKPVVGAPTVKGAKVIAKVIKEVKGDKVLMVKRKRRSGHIVKKGHRQEYTALLVTEITDGAGQTVKIDATSKRAEKYLK